MQPKDMPEPPDGARVIVIESLRWRDLRVFQRDDARAKRNGWHPEDDHWYEEVGPRADGTEWSWREIVSSAQEVYVVTLAAKKEPR